MVTEGERSGREGLTVSFESSITAMPGIQVVLLFVA
jgi:hypothetical protein